MRFKRFIISLANRSRQNILSARQYSQKLLDLLSTMQRPIDKHIQEAQKQRKMIKERSSKYSASVITLQVLGSGASGCPKSVFVFTDQSRYLFNCGEGTQRLAHEHKMKLARLEHIFFTSASWKSMGGLPGVALTLQDTGVPKIFLHGPPDLDEIFKATRRFVILKDMKIEMSNCSPDTFYDDPVMTIKYVPLMKILNDSTNVESNGTMDNLELDNTDYYAHESSGRRDLQNINIDNLMKGPTKDQMCSMAYICKLKPNLGTLDLQKCVAKGVKPGPNLGLLKSGQDVTLPNGTMIYAKDVRTPDDPGPVFIVIDVPHLDFLDGLFTSKEFAPHQEHENMNEDDRPSVIIHFTPSDVLETSKYQNFMKTFSPETSHLIVNDSNTCPGSIAITRVQSKLNLLDNKIFPVLKTYLSPVESPSKEMNDLVNEKLNSINNEQLVEHIKTRLKSSERIPEDSVVDSSNIIYAKTFTSFHLRPKKGLDRSSEKKSDILEYIGETLLYPGVAESLENIYAIKSQLHPTCKQEYPKVAFFGTGSCIPNKTRNTSCIVVQTNDECNIIMDCGEGSFGQMARYYGKDDLVNIMKNLKAIYLSHLHADHHLGLIGILQGRREILKSLGIEDIKPVYLLAPKQIMTWLWLYHRRFERIIHEFELISNSSLCVNCQDHQQLEDSTLNEIGLKAVETCFVRHCPNSFGVTITTTQNKKITYSGDTMPCAELVRIGLDSDLLIHEATMEDALAGEAKYKMHSTVSQAVDIGREMKAKFTILTHFSQRYARVPILPADIENSCNKNVGVAFDNMEVTFDDLPILCNFYPALKLMFAEHFENLESRAMKRAIKRERNQSPTILNRQETRNVASFKCAKKPTID